MTDRPTIGLAELTRAADFQTRQDRKYLVPRESLDEVISALPPALILRIDGATTFPYESVYFDTPDLASYADAAKRRPRRFKVRTRTYAASDQCMLEVKVRDARGRTVKHRIPHPVGDRATLTADADAFIRSVPEVTRQAGQLHASLVTTYERSTYMLEDRQARVTVDLDLRWSTRDDTVLELPDLAIIETKSPGHPSSFDRVLWRMGFRPSTVSKYCTGLAALRSELPANKWHRVLSQPGWRPATGQ